MQPPSQGLNSVQEPKSLQDWAGAGTEVDRTTSKQPEDLAVTLVRRLFWSVSVLTDLQNFSLQMTTQDLGHLLN